MANTRKTFWYVTQSAAVYRSAKVWFDNREAALRYHDAHNYTDAPKAVTFRRPEKIRYYDEIITIQNEIMKRGF